MKTRTALRLSATLVLVWACGLVVPRAEIIEQILVKVNGEIFTKTDLEARQVAVLRQKGVQLDIKDSLTDTELRRQLNAVTPQIMAEAVDEMLIVQRGRELGYTLSDEQFKTVLDNIKRENKLDTEEKFQGALKQENMTMADLRRQLERSMIVQRVQQNEVFGRIGVSDEEARAYYDAHLAEFTTAASVTLREILVAVPNDGKTINVGQDEAARDRAEAIRTRAAGGEDFVKLAAELSAAPSRPNGGLIGPLSMNDLSPELRKLIEPLKKDELTPVVRTQRGYQFFKVDSIVPSETLPFEKARDQINDRVFTTKRREEFDKYLVKLRAQAIIDWKNEDVKKAYEEGIAQGHNGAPAS